jgi:sugar lactone lactonase YvrE
MWHSSRKSCLWVDIQKDLLFELNWETQKTQIWHTLKKPSLVVEGKNDSVLLAVKGGLIMFDLETGNQQKLVDIEKDVTGNRCNDGACDSSGRLWIGTMDIDCKDNSGNLYCMDHAMKIKKKINNLTIPNGLVWSLDNERMYFIDSPSQCVKSYLSNKKNGEIYFENIAVHIPAEIGMPDGMTIDADGKLWVALWGGAAICRYDPANGELLDMIKMPAINITSCKFVGENLDSLLVTSAREGLSDEQLDEFPESGNVFIINDLPAVGVKANTVAI